MNPFYTSELHVCKRHKVPWLKLFYTDSDNKSDIVFILESGYSHREGIE
jgi:hypothetical protein